MSLILASKVKKLTEGNRSLHVRRIEKRNRFVLLLFCPKE